VGGVSCRRLSAVRATRERNCVALALRRVVACTKDVPPAAVDTANANTAKIRVLDIETSPRNVRGDRAHAEHRTIIAAVRYHTL
jgi:hypothetical protein